MSSKPIFSSRLASILTMIGVAVGLGNVWRFPYMMGKYGGSAFLFVYLAFTVLFAIPALVGEITLGRLTRNGPIGAFRKALGPYAGGAIGILLLVTILTAISYYTVVIANVTFSAFFSVVNGFDTQSIERYSTDLADGSIQYLIAIIILGASLLVIHRGLHKGIEWISKLFVPFFLVVILFLIYHTISLDGAIQHVIGFLRPDFASLEPVQIFAALGQAFYSLSLGGTFMVVYGNYLSKDESIISIASWTAVGDVGAALLTSLFVVPAVLIYQLDMTSGPTLIFETLPRLFGEMPAGQVVGSLFLMALSSVAILSLVAALDVARTCINELFHRELDQRYILAGIGIAEFIMIYPSAQDANLVGLLDLIFGSGMQVLGSGLVLIAVTWGLGKIQTKRALKFPDDSGLFNSLFWWMKWIIPLVLLLVLIGYIYSTISG